MEPDEDLGEVRSRHGGSRREAWLVAGVTSVGSAAALAALEAPAWSYVLPLVVGAGLFFVFLMLSPRAVVLRERGLELHRWVLPPRMLRFEAVTAAYWEFSTKTSLFGTFVIDSAVRLVGPLGRSLKLNPRSFQSADEIFPRIGRLCVWPGHQLRLEAFQRGEEVAFGQLAAGPAGVRIGSLSCSWEELERVEISPVQFIFHFRGRRWRRSHRLERVPYAFTFLHLLAEKKVPLSAFDGFALR